MNDITVYQLSVIAVLFVITACLSYIARKMPSNSERRVAPLNQSAIPLEPSTSQIGFATEAFVEEGENSTQPVENWKTTAKVTLEDTAGIDECGIIDAAIIGLPGAVTDEIDGSDLMMICGNEEGKFRSQSSQSSLTDDQVSTKKDDVFQQEQSIQVVTPNQPPYDSHPLGYGYQPVPVSMELPQAQTENLDENHVQNVVTNPEHENNNQSVIDTIEINHQTNTGKEAIEDEQMQMDSDKLQHVVVDAELSHELTKEIVPEDTLMADTITDVEMMAKLKIKLRKSTDNLNANNDRNSPNIATSAVVSISAVSPQEAPANEGEAEDRDENSCGKTMPIISNTDEEVNVNQTVLKNHVIDVTADSNIETRSSGVEVNETQEIDETSVVHHLSSPLENESENSRKQEGSAKDDERTTQDTSQSDNVE
ncbi:uncharacterized protein LOC117103131 [Anneissia japonica]|uniref:uncharacterized protein LOC117103131 n=1 Tax=Anneissia japonica TaxID=1529436 RepID=UPI001425B70D|nr:uncharacterized protein LOC117103131 [Anneissia japonica]XP_033099527.1 uncharacterized protein LOC117103131 [Anneissia japonica]